MTRRLNTIRAEGAAVVRAAGGREDNTASNGWGISRRERCKFRVLNYRHKFEGSHGDNLNVRPNYRQKCENM